MKTYEPKGTGTKIETRASAIRRINAGDVRDSDKSHPNGHVRRVAFLARGGFDFLANLREGYLVKGDKHKFGENKDGDSLAFRMFESLCPNVLAHIRGVSKARAELGAGPLPIEQLADMFGTNEISRAFLTRLDVCWMLSNMKLD